MGLPFHRFVLSSNRLLRQHLTGQAKPLTIDSALRALFLDERDSTITRPDHALKALRDHEFQGVDTLRELLLRTFTRLTEHYFEFRQRRLFVKANRFADWQRLSTRLSPLVLVTFALQREFAVDGRFERVDDHLLRFLTDHLSPSVLPTVYCPQLDDIITRNGLDDLHVHLNGSTEADSVWLDTLNHPRRFYKEIKSSYRTSAPQSVREQYEQIEDGLSPETLYIRLRLARALRFALCQWVFGGDKEILEHLDYAIDQRMFRFDDHQIQVRGHPLRAFCGTAKTPDTVCEGAFWWMMFSHLHRPEGGAITSHAHVYLLLLAQFNHFAVQQVDQKGFDQFQKITVNEFRSLSEKDYRQRFDQLARTDSGDLAFLEGRFAPKRSARDNWGLISKILKGYARHHGTSRPQITDQPPLTETRRLHLGLTAHFIKRADPPHMATDGSALFGPWRYAKLRNDINTSAKALLALHRRSPLVRRYLVGIDAASNELHTPPDVFAPLYRLFRFHGFHHFTYHAGEDFRHLLSGMRAVVEAVEFLDLRRGDRIGHATALGLDPDLWQTRNEGLSVVPLEEWLDNLLFAYWVLSESGTGQTFLFKLREDISRHAHRLYGSGYQLDPHILLTAWRLRKLDPRMVFTPDRAGMMAVSEFTKRELSGIAQAERDHPAAFSLLQAWHSAQVRRRGIDMQTITTDDAPTALLVAVQQAALEKIVRQDIILESMLTSNVRISVYQDYGEHHIHRWLGTGNDLASPTVVMATDDPGIFSNSLRNDFIHLIETLRQSGDYTPEKVLSVIQSLAHNARVFRFRALGG